MNKFKLVFKTPCHTWDIENLMSCIFGIKSSDVRVYFDLLINGPSKISDIAKRIDRERSTVQRAVQNLLTAGLVTRKQVNLKEGGYYYIYEAIPFEDVKKIIKENIEEWSKNMITWINNISLEDIKKEMGE
ncbi:helix-turn-helix domain-containing protein [Methanocaldococcus indicus]|uniref:helix-turn-helix domain-containing protein n=1 Tax=Methanocaldococcus indicus TaxID=213231 RepID=UPI003C6D7379